MAVTVHAPTDVWCHVQSVSIYSRPPRGHDPPARQLLVLAMVAGGIVAVKVPYMREVKRGLAAFTDLAGHTPRGFPEILLR
jgi:hypothetical protein